MTNASTALCSCKGSSCFTSQFPHLQKQPVHKPVYFYALTVKTLQ